MNITLKAPAKINLFLDITSKREDGYHNIESVMQTVDLYDTINIIRHEESGRKISIICSNPTLPCDEKNLCHRAAARFFEQTNIDNYNIEINVEKNIPVSAGLGGGSTDAAAVFIGLDKLFETNLSLERLCKMASTVGADIPFCIKKGISRVRGIGDIFEYCPPLPDCFTVIACGGEEVSTPWAYCRLDEMYDFSCRDVNIDRFISSFPKGIAEISRNMENIFESAVIPEKKTVAIAKELMKTYGCLNSLMSGSGSAVFGIFDCKSKAQTALAQLVDSGFKAFLCKPCHK